MAKRVNKQLSDLDPEIKAVLLKVAEVWDDKNFIGFIEKYEPELYEALLDFMVDTDYHNLSTLNEQIFYSLPFRGGKMYPAFMRDLAIQIEALDCGRCI